MNSFENFSFEYGVSEQITPLVKRVIAKKTRQSKRSFRNNIFFIEIYQNTFIYFQLLLYNLNTTQSTYI